MIFNQFAPTPDMVAAEEEAQASSGVWGTIGTILSLPEKALFGQAIKGAIKGGAEGGFAGAVKGFARGTPFAFLGEALGLGDLADETRFSDIRTAMGGTDVEEGWGNFFLNLAGDILTSPVELLAVPFGLTAKGASAVARGTAKASIARAVAVGERAALVFKVPFAKNGFAATNLGFKSGPILVGQGLDAIGGFLRTNAVTGPVVRMFSHAAATRDPEVAAQAAKGVLAVDESRRAFRSTSLMAYQDGVSASGKELVEAGRYGNIITSLTEYGVEKIDDFGTYDHAIARLTNADVTLREARRDALLRTPGESRFKNLWLKAKTGDEDAIKVIRDQFSDVPLEPSMMQTIGMVPRPGVEASWVTGADTLAEALDPAVRGLPSAGSTGTIKRSVVAGNTPSGAVTATLKAREALKSEYTQLIKEIEAGTVDKAGLDSFLKFHKEQMIRLGQADIQNGFLNATSEPFLGLYAPRMMSKGAMDLVEDHFAATLSRYNYSSPRKLRDMLAVEINAVAEDFGLKATGFASLKKLRDADPETVLASIFDRTFLRQLHKVDPQAAEFFQILPAHNVFTRVAETGERLAKRAFGKTFYADDSPAVLEVLTVDQFTKRAPELLVPGGDKVAVVETKGAVQGLTRADAIEQAMGPEIASQYEVASHHIRTDALARMQDVKRDAVQEIKSLREIRDLGEDAIPAKLAQKKDDLLAVHNLKRSVLDIRAAKDARDAAIDLRRLHNLKTGAKGKNLMDFGRANDPALNDLYAAIKAEGGDTGKKIAARLEKAQKLVKSTQEAHRAQKTAIDDFLDDMATTLDEITGETNQAIKGAQGQRRDALDFLTTDKNKRLDLVRRLRERGLSGRAFAQEFTLQEQYSKHGVMALDEAAKIPAGDGTLLDRLKKRWGADTKIKIVTRESHDAFKKIADDMARPDPFQHNGVVKFFDNFKTAWAGHTIYNPLFLQTRARNFVQNNVAAASGGLATVGGQYESARAMSALRASIKGDKTAFNALAADFIKGTQISLQDGLQSARKLGVIGAGGYAYEAGLTVEQAAMLTGKATLKDKIKDLPSLLFPDVRGIVGGKVRGVQGSYWLQKGFKAESLLDDHSRLAAYFAGLKKGLEPEAAAREVRKWLYDSSQPLTWTERTVFRRLMPFYSFQKYAVGQMADLYFSRPATVTTFEKIRRNAYEAHGLDATTLQTVLPRYIADGYGIPYKNTERGPEVGLFGTFFPVGEVAKIATAFDSQFGSGEDTNPAVRYIFSNMHPAMRGIAEVLMKRDYYADRPIEDFPGQTQEMFGVAVPKQMARWAQQLRLVNELNRLNVINANEAKLMIDAVDRGTEKAQSGFATRLLSSAFSPVPVPRAQVIDVGKEARYRQAKTDEKLRAAKGRIVRRAIGPDKATSEADLEALQTVFTEQAATTRLRDKARAKYADPNGRPERPPTNMLERLLLNR